MSKNSNPLCIEIIGPGAIGCAVAALLASQGHQVILKGRSGVIQSSFTVYSHYTSDKLLFNHKKKPEKSSKCDLQIYCVKTYDLESAIKQHNIKSVPILAISNGWVLDLLSDLSRKYKTRIDLGLCFFGATNKGDMIDIYSSSEPKILVNNSWYGQDMKSVFSYNSDFETSYLNKWLINTTLNTLCGVYKLSTNGQALTHLEILKKLFEESKSLLKSMGYKTESLINFDRFIESIKLFGENSNSMYLDVINNKPNECSYLSGLVVGKSGFELLKKFNSVLAISKHGSLTSK